MRWLTLFIVAVSVVVPDPAFALPQPDAESAYARGDYATAFKVWLPLAEQGSPRAQLAVARMYERGEWVAKDPAMASEWYRRAAEQGAPMPATYVTPTPVSYPPPLYLSAGPHRVAHGHHHRGPGCRH